MNFLQYPNRKGDKIYFHYDYGRGKGQRLYHLPLVSTPLEWKEVKKGLDRYAFTIDTLQERLNKKGDLWEKLNDEKIISANNKSLSKL